MLMAWAPAAPARGAALLERALGAVPARPTGAGNGASACAAGSVELALHRHLERRRHTVTCRRPGRGLPLGQRADRRGARRRSRSGCATARGRFPTAVCTSPPLADAAARGSLRLAARAAGELLGAEPTRLRPPRLRGAPRSDPGSRRPWTRPRRAPRCRMDHHVLPPTRQGHARDLRAAQRREHAASKAATARCPLERRQALHGEHQRMPIARAAADHSRTANISRPRGDHGRGRELRRRRLERGGDHAPELAAQAGTAGESTLRTACGSAARARPR